MKCPPHVTEEKVANVCDLAERKGKKQHVNIEYLVLKQTHGEESAEIFVPITKSVAS